MLEKTAIVFLHSSKLVKCRALIYIGVGRGGQAGGRGGGKPPPPNNFGGRGGNIPSPLPPINYQHIPSISV